MMCPVFCQVLYDKSERLRDGVVAAVLVLPLLLLSVNLL